MLIAHLAAKVVHRIVAAKQDAVVAGNAVVVKLVGHVGNALTMLPADGGQLFWRQRLGHQHVVVYRDGVPAITLEQRGKGIGSQHHPCCVQLALRRMQRHLAAAALQPGHRRLFINLHPQLTGHPCQLQHQLAGVDHRRAVLFPEAGQEGGRIQFGADFRRTHIAFAAQLLVLVGLYRHHQHAGALEITVDAITLDGGFDFVQITQAQCFQLGHFLWPALVTVFFAMSEAGFAKAAVAAGSGPAYTLCFQQYHAARRVALLGQNGGPQSEKTTADNGQRGIGAALELGKGAAAGGHVVTPERAVDAIGQCAVDQRACGSLTFENDLRHKAVIPCAHCTLFEIGHDDRRRTHGSLPALANVCWPCRYGARPV